MSTAWLVGVHAYSISAVSSTHMKAGSVHRIDRYAAAPSFMGKGQMQDAMSTNAVSIRNGAVTLNGNVLQQIPIDI